MEMVVIAAFLACRVLFWLTAPALLFARTRYGYSWWLVVVSATVLSWTFVNGSIFFQKRAVDIPRQHDAECFNQPAHSSLAVYGGDRGVRMQSTSDVSWRCGCEETSLSRATEKVG
jgi:hypothetical protein